VIVARTKQAPAKKKKIKKKKRQRVNGGRRRIQSKRTYGWSWKEGRWDARGMLERPSRQNILMPICGIGCQSSGVSLVVPDVPTEYLVPTW
jgi:hypothetical protein